MLIKNVKMSSNATTANNNASEAIITVYHPLCDNVRLSIPHDGLRPEYKVCCVLSLHCYITKQYTKLVHYKGGIYPFYVQRGNNELSEKYMLSKGNCFVMYAVCVMREAINLLYINTENHVAKKVRLIKEAKTRIVDFLVNHISPYVFDITSNSYDSIPHDIRKKMVDKYIKKRFPEIISGDVIVKKFGKEMSFSNFTDINLLLQYNTFLQNRLRKKEKATEDFLKKKFSHAMSYNNFIRESKHLYYGLYPERKTTIGSSRPVSVLRSAEPSNVTMRYSQVPAPGSGSQRPVALSTPVRIHFNNSAKTLVSIQSSNSIPLYSKSKDVDEPEVKRVETVESRSDDEKLVITDNDVFVPETNEDEETDSESSDQNSLKRTYDKSFSSVTDTAKRRRN